MYKIVFAQKAIKFLRSLPDDYKNVVTKKMRELEMGPVPRSSTQLKGRDKCFRLRIGPFRVQYHILENEHTILVYSIGKRDETTYK